jgi:DHA1 family bicyclomycin/chloramphenicol resistance-like MFS transporter
MSERRVSLIGAMLVAIGPFSMSLYTPAMPEIVTPSAPPKRR